MLLVSPPCPCSASLCYMPPARRPPGSQIGDRGLRRALPRGPIGAMVASTRHEPLLRLALWGSALASVCAGLPACRSNRALPDATPDASPKPAAAAPKPDAQGPKTPAAPSKLHRIGETARATGYQFRVERIKQCETEPYFRPRAGNVKLGVEVTVESTASIPIRINPFHAFIRDSRGKSYYFTLAGCEPALQAARLEPEQKAEGWLSFEVPKSANDLELGYGPPTANRAPPEVRFTLRRE